MTMTLEKHVGTGNGQQPKTPKEPHRETYGEQMDRLIARNRALENYKPLPDDHPIAQRNYCVPEITRWVNSYFRELIDRPHIREVPGLVDTLLGIADCAYHSSDPCGGADYLPGAMCLYELEPYMADSLEIVEECISYMETMRGKGGIIDDHLKDFREGKYIRPFE